MINFDLRQEFSVNLCERSSIYLNRFTYRFFKVKFIPTLFRFPNLSVLLCSFAILFAFFFYFYFSVFALEEKRSRPYLPSNWNNVILKSKKIGTVRFFLVVLINRPVIFFLKKNKRNKFHTWYTPWPKFGCTWSYPVNYELVVFECLKHGRRHAFSLDEFPKKFHLFDLLLVSDKIWEKKVCCCACTSPIVSMLSFCMPWLWIRLAGIY